MENMESGGGKVGVTSDHLANERGAINILAPYRK